MEGDAGAAILWTGKALCALGEANAERALCALAAERGERFALFCVIRAYISPQPLDPFLYGLYWKKTTRAACLVNFIFGAGFMTCNMLFRPQLPALLQSPINAGAFVMLAGLIIVPVVSLITPKQDEKEVDRIFSCYNKKNEVPVTQSLSD